VVGRADSEDAAADDEDVGFCRRHNFYFCWKSWQPRLIFTRCSVHFRLILRLNYTEKKKKINTKFAQKLF
jgi:hypothetical protein